jgi:4-amino-4-deoxy-L-arabinose transferase-like glycosyltransferase
MDIPTKSAIRLLRTHLLPLALLALVLVVSIIVRIRLLNAPLERDEGEHAYLAQTLLAGHAPWQLAYNLKLPGTDFMYAVFLALFGQTAAAIRLGLLLVNTATILLTALLGKRLFGITGGIVAGAAYGLLSCSQNVMGTVAHSTHYVAFFAVIATLLLLEAGTRPRWLFFSGLVYGVAFLMKQPSLSFGVFGAVYVVWLRRRDRLPFVCAMQRLALFYLGLVLPYGLLCLALLAAGTFDRFWFWTYTLARAFATQESLPQQYENFKYFIPNVLGPDLYLWILAGLGLLASLWMPVTRRAGLFVAVLLLFSFVAVSGGGTFIPHYFIMMLPAVALAVGALAAWGEKMEQLAARSWRSLITQMIGGAPLVLFAAACLWSVWLQRAYLFEMSPYEFSRSTYGLNPFPEAEKVAEYIRLNSRPDARIAVVGSEAEIYFYSRRQAATGYLFTYGLMETHPYATISQQEMIGEITRARPEYIVFVGIAASWLPHPGSDQEIFRWAFTYTHQNYDIVGAVNLVPGEPAGYAWGPDAKLFNAGSPYYLTVYRRR